MLLEPRLDLLSQELLSMLRCPVCKGELDHAPAELRCPACQRLYPIALGIPDLRVYEDPLIPLEDDYRKGAKVQAQAERLSFADLVRYYWSLPTDPYTPPAMIDRFVRHVLTDEARIGTYLDRLGSGQRFLEVGCGTAGLVQASHGQFDLAVGCDVAFRWLLIARRRLQEADQPAHLVCCCADHLPFPDGFFSTVASVALLEHMPKAQGAAIREFARVLTPDGRVFTWTTNRFSIAPEPHVRVWGVGFLPRPWMPAYVKWASGLAYENKYLLSIFETRKLLQAAGLTKTEFSIPKIAAEDLAHLSGLEKLGARVFESASRWPLLRGPLASVFPVLMSVARRDQAPSEGIAG